MAGFWILEEEPSQPVPNFHALDVLFFSSMGRFSFGVKLEFGI